MSRFSVIALGVLFSFLTIFLLGKYYEGGDASSASMYLVVFLMPGILIAIINGLYIGILNKMENKIKKALLCLVPVTILLALSFIENITIAGLDGNLVFVVKAELIAIAMTNFIWIFKMRPRLTVKKNSN